MENTPIKILLVDDREDNLFSMESVLSEDDYVISKAKSGKEALKILLKEVDFTLILMDVQMPGLNGFETAALIYERDKLKHIPVIFVTANDYNEDYIFRGYQAGAVDYIYKPINPNLLRAKVAVFADLYRKNHLLMQQEKELHRINTNLEERVKERTDELLKKNEELESINKILKKVNNDLDNFVYAASHDLKAPVSNIEGLLTTLNDYLDPDKTDDNIKMILELIDKSVIRFKSTIHELTEITKIQKGVEEDYEIIDIMDVLDDVKTGILDLVDKNNAIINVDCNIDTKIKYSRRNLNSILYNLISNAIKYRSPERNPVVELKIFYENDFLVLNVKDNGLGFDMKDCDKMFSMFKRLHSHVDGSGVGLYIVKRIVENTGGSIIVNSVIGEGSSFKVNIKLEDETVRNPELISVS